MVSCRLAALLISAGAASFTDVDDAALSLLQVRSHASTEKRSSGDLDFGHDVVERPYVDENKCDSGICPLEVLDNSLGAMNAGPGVITGVRFYAAQAGNFGLRFRVYRHVGAAYSFTGETEEIAVPTVGVMEYTFKQPLAFLYEDWVGFVHNGHGNIAYSEAQPDDRTVVWNSFNGWVQPPEAGKGYGGRGCYPFNQMGQTGYTTPSGADDNGHNRRTYSYSFTTRGPTNADYNDLNLCSMPRPGGLPDFPPQPEPEPPQPEPPQPEPENDGAAAVGDPHITTNVGRHFDMKIH